jgi:thiol-disulfide isomerase/thioredoxin
VLAAHRGEVVLVDFWATWCAPCLADFPELVQLHHALAPRGLAVVSISVDDPAEKDGKVRRFLGQHRPGFETLILDVPVIDDFMAAVDADWTGAVPAVFLYDRRGALRHAFFGVTPAEEIEQTAKTLLAQPPPAEAE